MPIPLPKFSRHRLGRVGLIGLVCAGLVLAACTRSANPSSALPTATTAAEGTAHVLPGLSDEEATFAAVGTQVAGSLTATAAALMGSGAGGEAVTPAVPTIDPALLLTPLPGALPTDPPVGALPPIETATPIPQPAAPAAACPNPYTVQQGEWIYAIARKCGLSAQAIIAANPGIDPHRLSPGQVINLPAPGTGPVPGVPVATVAPTGCTGTYTVVTGDTLWRISTRCGYTVEQLAAANGIPFPYSSISVGQVLRFP